MMGSAAFIALLLSKKYKEFSKFVKGKISDIFLNFLPLNNFLAKIE
jgi:hypothetical protein